MSLVTSKTRITDLPDEVLVLIFYYLEGVDKIKMNKTCRRFSEILKERKLSRKLDVSSSYYYTLSDLKSYVTPRAFGKNLRVLNITSCYWLNSLDILYVVRKMENLEALYAADTQLCIDHVIILVGCLPQLRRISFTWFMRKLSARIMAQRCSHITSSLASIEFMSFYINTEYFLRDDVRAIVIWLNHCTNLEELTIIGLHQMIPIGEYIFSGNIQLTHKFPRLHTLVLSVPGHETPYGQLAELYHIICMAVGQVKNWQCLWVISPTSLFEILPESLNNSSAFLITRGNMNLPRDTLPNLEQLMTNSSDLSSDILGSEMPVLKRLSWCVRQMSYVLANIRPMDGDVLAPEWKMSWDTLWNACCQLEEVNIGSCLRDIDNIYILQNLTKLALPKCILRGNTRQPSSKAEKANKVIRTVVESCPNIKEFEFTPCKICTFLANDLSYESTLTVFGKWTQLQRLKLEGLECIRTGRAVFYILKMCPNLESISLKDLGAHGLCTYMFELRKALEHCKNLKEFRLEQANIGFVGELLRALESCTMLERIAIFTSYHSKAPKERDVLDLIEKLKHLVFLYMEVENWPAVHCRSLDTAIRKVYKDSRPALLVSLNGGAMRAIKQSRVTSGRHFFEMVEDESRIGTKLGNGRSFISTT